MRSRRPQPKRRSKWCGTGPTAGDHPARIYPEVRGAWSPDAFGASMNHFLEALDTGRPYLCSGHDNLRTVAIAEAAYLSAEHSREVKPAELGV
ncbi:MAG TPA: Gfo/Idh/MocA family oxidoreductase [Armatimonadota bacterium]